MSAALANHPIGHRPVGDFDGLQITALTTGAMLAIDIEKAGVDGAAQTSAEQKSATNDSAPQLHCAPLNSHLDEIIAHTFTEASPFGAGSAAHRLSSTAFLKSHGAGATTTNPRTPIATRKISCIALPRSCLYAPLSRGHMETLNDGSKRIHLYVLDECFRVILATADPKDPLNALYEATSAADELPPSVDTVVRAMTADWHSEDEPSRSTRLGDVEIAVIPLHGPIGPHIAVLLSRTV